ncbi:hypothetical protein H4582DRAFT_2057737 [Lactarius indigo]|nr:hypothetical protein H4582DRAFT_2057737 [Lactarius indigo]
MSMFVVVPNYDTARTDAVFEELIVSPPVVTHTETIANGNGIHPTATGGARRHNSPDSRFQAHMTKGRGRRRWAANLKERMMPILDWTGSQTNKLNKLISLQPPSPLTHTHRIRTRTIYKIPLQQIACMWLNVCCRGSLQHGSAHIAASVSPSRSNIPRRPPSMHRPPFWPFHLVTVRDHGTRPTLSSAVAAAAAPDGTILRLNPAHGQRRMRNTASPSGTLFPFFGDKPTDRQTLFFFRTPSLGLSEPYAKNLTPCRAITWHAPRKNSSKARTILALSPPTRARGKNAPNRMLELNEAFHETYNLTHKTAADQKIQKQTGHDRGGDGGSFILPTPV